MFVYKQWENFCKALDSQGINSVTAASLLEGDLREPFIILKHDVETNPSKALKLAEIEAKYSHRGSYYVQAYLLKDKANIPVLKRIQDLGHEVSYHHDVMDSNCGNLEEAKKEFQENITQFIHYGFSVKTVCQHGNPVVDRAGYTSNRDFFRDKGISETFPDITEIMLNYKSKIGVNYKYISDAGYGWKIIYDPENNDIINTSDKDITLERLDCVTDILKNKNNAIVSTHPHRWQSSAVKAAVKELGFKRIRAIAKAMIRIPVMRKLMERFYFLAKKI